MITKRSTLDNEGAIRKVEPPNFLDLKRAEYIKLTSTEDPKSLWKWAEQSMKDATLAYAKAFGILDYKMVEKPHQLAFTKIFSKTL